MRRSNSGFVRGAGGRPINARGGPRGGRGSAGRGGGVYLVPPKPGRGRAVPQHALGRAGPGRGHAAAGRASGRVAGPGRPGLQGRRQAGSIHKSRRKSPKTSIKVLVCSANMGNAQPDPTSINHWIPSDGFISLAVKDPPKFPVMFSAEPTEAETDESKKRASKVDLKGESTDPEFFAFLEKNKDNDFASHDDAYEAFLASQHTTHIEEPEPVVTVPASGLPVEDDYESFLANQGSAKPAPEVFDYNTPVEVNNADDDYEAFLARQAASQPTPDTFDYNTPVVNGGTSADDDYEAFLAKQAQEASHPFDNSMTSSTMSAGGNGSSSHVRGNSSRTGSSGIDRDRSTKDISSAGSKKIDPHEQFDIVVIGMQEATFETEGGNASDDDIDLLDDDSSISSSDEEDTFTAVTESLISEDGDEVSTEVVTADGKKKKTLTKKMFGATKKATKATLKATTKTAKVTLKVGKGTLKAGGMAVEAGKAAKQLTMAKDHTTRHVDTALKETSSSSWSDTRTLHYLFEKQLPSYKRSLSYQLGQMRLVVYTRSPGIEVELLGVKYEPTGKHGLANKGGIVSEILVNKTTRLSFLTAHLEAHVSIHYLHTPPF